MKIGIITDCLKKPLEESIPLAKQIGLEGVQIYAGMGKFTPDTLTAEQKEFYKKLLKDNELVVSALCGDLGGRCFEVEEENGWRIEKTKKIIDLALEFGANVVTVHIGVIPDDENDPQFKTMLKALTACGDYAYSKGATLAIETGPETAPTLLKFVSKIKHGVGVNLDPANFVMVTGQDPVEAVYMLKDYIVHTHLKDGKMLKKTDPRRIYGDFADGGIEALNIADYFIETPIGQGDVDFNNYIKALKDIGFDGFLTFEREAGDNPLDDIKTAKAYIEKILG